MRRESYECEREGGRREERERWEIVERERERERVCVNAFAVGVFVSLYERK